MYMRGSVVYRVGRYFRYGEKERSAVINFASIDGIKCGIRMSGIKGNEPDGVP